MSSSAFVWIFFILFIVMILLEVPISVTEADEDAYPSGDGWRVLTEDAYEQEKKSEGDPRLAKLKEFKE